MESVNALTALFAGALSFLSPCVLPIVPAYLGRLAALSAGTSRMRHALLFTCGFSAIFIALGISAGYVGGAAGRLLPILQIPVGVAVTIGGLHGSVTEVASDAVTIEVAKGVRLKFERAAIARMQKPAPEGAAS